MQCFLFSNFHIYSTNKNPFAVHSIGTKMEVNVTALLPICLLSSKRQFHYLFSFVEVQRNLKWPFCNLRNEAFVPIVNHSIVICFRTCCSRGLVKGILWSFGFQHYYKLTLLTQVSFSLNEASMNECLIALGYAVVCVCNKKLTYIIWQW